MSKFFCDKQLGCWWPFCLGRFIKLVMSIKMSLTFFDGFSQTTRQVTKDLRLIPLCENERQSDITSIEHLHRKALFTRSESKRKGTLFPEEIQLAAHIQEWQRSKKSFTLWLGSSQFKWNLRWLFFSIRIYIFILWTDPSRYPHWSQNRNISDSIVADNVGRKR